MKQFGSGDMAFISDNIENEMIPEFLKKAIIGTLGQWPELGVRVKVLSFGHAYQLMTSDILEDFCDVKISLGKFFSKDFPEVFLAYGSEQMDKTNVSTNFLFKSPALIFILQTRAPVLPTANRNFQQYEETREKAEENFLMRLKQFQSLAQSANELQNLTTLPAGARICYIHSDF
ncbi:MAG: hypothetical protein LBF26_02595 [Puniceicoccales bacterium]|jgi:hypothetical protein|nr:hypothetical protein [Puniceicoccales bacterium]